MSVASQRLHSLGLALFRDCHSGSELTIDTRFAVFNPLRSAAVGHAGEGEFVSPDPRQQHAGQWPGCACTFSTPMTEAEIDTLVGAFKSGFAKLASIG